MPVLVARSQKYMEYTRAFHLLERSFFCEVGIKIIKVQCVGKLQVEGSYKEIKYPETSQVF